ncbi:prephenate dehydrogenase [Halanaerobium salsuginis]|nr:prephenate dehydrogenase/arogenate dehydrogenase family protein [Halanaerobium salsuginis]
MKKEKLLMLNFKKIAVVGLGLIGASLAAALKEINPTLTIIGIDNKETTLKTALNRGFIDTGYLEISKEVLTAELIFIAVPVASIGSIIAEIEALGSADQLLVDLGSTKVEVMKQAAEILAASSRVFIGGHPMAGSDKSGIKAVNQDLFKNAAFILTPGAHLAEEDKSHSEQISPISKNDLSLSAEKLIINQLSQVEKDYLTDLKELIIELGARPYILRAVTHDQWTAYLSHFPHLLSASLVNLVPEANILELAGSGYQDMTRIAGSSPELWLDIIFSNRINLIELLTAYQKELADLKKLLVDSDQTQILEFLKTAAAKKQQ